MSDPVKRPTTAKSWTIETRVGLLIDGEVFPWHVAADPLPMVEPLDAHLHILWLPVFMDGPAPASGRPTGTSVTLDEETDR